MKLIIAEKPSVAKSIASALGVKSGADGSFQGNGYIVSWCVGHLVSPMDAAGYNENFKKWRYDDLPILPEPFRYVIAPGKEAAFENLRTLMNRPDVDTVVNACDAGREGELIFRLVYEMTGCNKPIERLWISSMEDSAIREGMNDLRPGAEYDALYQSALCRQKADWLVGINATRLFSVLYHRTLNVGRVQTPTLAMLAEREAKTMMFRKEKYHHVRLKVNGAEAVSEKIVSPEDAEKVKAACADRSAVCVSVKREQKKEQPPKLYDLTTLQREANRIFGYTAKQTLDYAQALYEKKLLTYPRTGATATYTSGQEFPETVTKGDVFVYGDYEYRYNQRIAYGSLWMDYTSQNGWGVFALSKTKTSYGPIQEVINGQPITSLGMTFENCKNMTQSPEIPDTVIHMVQTFNGCSSLEVLPELPDCVNYMSSTFASCTSLVDISYFVIPSNVKNLGGVWAGCTSLTDKGLPTIPGTVENVSNAFVRCTGLVDLSDYRFSEGTKYLYGTFEGCTSLKYAPDELPDSMIMIDSTFKDCTSLVRIPKIKSTVSSIIRAFYGCTSLEKVSDRLTIKAAMSIKYAFVNCTSLSDEITVSMYSNIGYEYQDCFKGTTQPITLLATKGSTMEKIYNLAATSENGNITVVELS